MDAAVTMHIAAAPADLAALANALRGDVMDPRDTAFEDTARIWNQAHQATPMAIVRVADAGDVATTVAFARSNGIEIAVRAGGHSVAGHSSGDGVLVIDLRALRGVHIDPAGGTVWAGAGLTAGELVTALAPHGLSVPFGDTGSVGIGGITLGGGIGYLVRKHGLTIDSLVAVEIVTASGEVLVASENEHADLFWAIRGGGGNFGIVTRFRYQAHPVDMVFGGAMVLPMSREVLLGAIEAAASAPDELSVIADVMDMPPLPFLPEEHHGRRAVLLTMIWVGDPDAGAAAVAPFRELATPLGEMVAPMPYPTIYAFTEGAGEPHADDDPLGLPAGAGRCLGGRHRRCVRERSRGVDGPAPSPGRSHGTGAGARDRVRAARRGDPVRRDQRARRPGIDRGDPGPGIAACSRPSRLPRPASTSTSSRTRARMKSLYLPQPRSRWGRAEPARHQLEPFDFQRRQLSAGPVAVGSASRARFQAARAPSLLPLPAQCHPPVPSEEIRVRGTGSRRAPPSRGHRPVSAAIPEPG